MREGRRAEGSPTPAYAPKAVPGNAGQARRKVPHGWISGDDEFGRPYAFRRRLDRIQERYLLADRSPETFAWVSSEP